MKLLQNKSTGEIGCLICSFGKTPEKITIVQYIDGKRGSKVWYYNSLAELNEEWEDYEEPKKYWYVYGEGVLSAEDNNDFEANTLKAIGNYFETREEAEKAVEKLKAWKRLKDNGFRFELWYYDGGNYQERIKTGRILFRLKDHEENDKDLDLLFGGEE